MSHRSRLFFLLLVVAQVAHSFEGYATRLYEVFAAARFVSGLFSDDVAVGFVIANAIIITVGMGVTLVRFAPDAARPGRSPGCGLSSSSRTALVTSFSLCWRGATFLAR